MRSETTSADADLNRAAPARANLASIRTLAVGSPNWLGDVMMAEPFLRVVHDDGRFRIVLFCRPNVADLCRALRRHLPSMDVFEYGSADRRENDPRTRLDPDETLWLNLAMDRDLLLLGHRRGGRWLRGFPREDTAPLITHALGPEFVDRRRHHVFNYLSLLPELGIEVPRELELPRLSGNGEPARPPEIANGRRLVVLNTASSNQPSKRYPAERFLALANLLLERFPDVAIVLTDSHPHAESNSFIASRALDRSRCSDSSGRFDVAELIALLGAARLVISGDTGPMHIAAALGVATIGIFGPTSPRWTAPVGPAAHYVRTAAQCAPCFQSPCPLPRQVCFDDVSPRAVLELIESKHLL
jgi:ADP-heptose:LPS heptosyltransferase